MNVLPQLGGYVNVNGLLNLKRLGLLLEALSVIDEDQFKIKKGVKNSSAFVNYQAEFQSFKERNSKFNFWLEETAPQVHKLA